MRIRDSSANRSMREMACYITGLVIKDMKGIIKYEDQIVGGETEVICTIQIGNNLFIGKSTNYLEAQKRAYQDFLYRISTVYRGTDWSEHELDQLISFCGNLN